MELREIIKHYNLYGFIPQDQQGKVISIAQAVEGAKIPDKRKNEWDGDPEYEYEAQGYNQALDDCRPFIAKLEGQLSQKCREVEELKNELAEKEYGEGI